MTVGSSDGGTGRECRAAAAFLVGVLKQLLTRIQEKSLLFWYKIFIIFTFAWLCMTFSCRWLSPVVKSFPCESVDAPRCEELGGAGPALWKEQSLGHG